MSNNTIRSKCRKYVGYIYTHTYNKARPVGRPSLRWMDQVEEDLKRMKVTGWRVETEDKEEWSRIVEQTKTHPGL
jgi:hypothetical protein